jgi:hypothetical protein
MSQGRIRAFCNTLRLNAAAKVYQRVLAQFLITRALQTPTRSLDARFEDYERLLCRVRLYLGDSTKAPGLGTAGPVGPPRHEQWSSTRHHGCRSIRGRCGWKRVNE